jgi:hypothetical protein
MQEEHDEHMQEQEANLAGPALAVLIEPERPDAGASFDVTVTVDVPDAAATTDLIAVLVDQDGEELATAPLGYDDEAKLGVAKLAAHAPESPGDHRWTVILRDGTSEDGETLAQEAADFEVGAHRIRPTVWGLPSAVEAAGTFRVSVGLRCTSTCHSAGWSFVVRDEEGADILTGCVGDEPAPRTEALHFAEIELPAPDKEGLHIWHIVPLCPEDGLPHTAQATEVRLNVVPRAEHVIRVRAIDASSGQPVEKAKVVAHPFRTFTDSEGRAELAVPRGTYTVFVSGRRYFPVRNVVDVEQEDTVEIVAELHFDRADEEVDQWA